VLTTQTGSVMDAAMAKPHPSLKLKLTNWEAWEIGTSDPIDAGENGPQKVRQASSMGIGREDAICEYIEIMQISSVRATMRCL
jgi:hypothetical protein